MQKSSYIFLDSAHLGVVGVDGRMDLLILAGFVEEFFPVAGVESCKTPLVHVAFDLCNL